MVVISAGQLHLRPFEARDLDPVYQIGMTEQIVTQLNMSAFTSKADAQHFLDMLMADEDSWAVIDSKEHVCGWIMLAPRLEDDLEAQSGFEYEIALALLPQYQHRGLMRVALPAVLQYYEAHRQTHLFYAAFFPANLASRKLLEHLHFQYAYQTTLPPYMGGHTIIYYLLKVNENTL